MNLKVSEIADMTGISRNKIYRFIYENKLDFVHGTKPKQYDEHVQSLIKQHFGKNDEQKMNNNEQNKQNQTDVNNNKQNQTILNNNEQLVNTLIKQLTEKDEQIKQLGKLLEHQQELTLNDKKTIETQSKKIEQLTVHENVHEQNQTKMNKTQTKKHFWNFFNRK